MNSKITAFALMACCAMGFVSCNEDADNPYAHVSSITIVSHDVDFDAPASRGTVHFSAPGAVTVTSTVDWCTAVVEADSVVVTVTQNPSINGRATQLELRCGNDVTNVSVTQMGVRVNFGHSGIGVETNEACHMRYPLSGNVELAIEGTSDWIEATLDNDTLSVDIQANNSGTIRFGEIVIGSEDYRDTIRVVQADYATDIEGNYQFVYYTNTGRERPIPVTYRNNVLTFLSYTIRMTFDPERGQFDIVGGQYVGQSETRDSVFLVFATQPVEENLYYWTGYSQETSNVAPIELSSDDDYLFTASFNTAIYGFAMERFLFRIFNGPTLSEEYDTGTSTMELNRVSLRRLRN